MKAVFVKKEEFFKDDMLFYMDRCEYLEYSQIRYHCHDFIEIAYVYSGKGKHIIDDIELTVTMGDLFVINRNVPHSFYPLDFENTNQLKVMNIIFVPDILENMEYKFTFLKKAIDVFIDKKEINDNLDICFMDESHIEISRLLEEMYTEYTKKKDGYCDILKLDLSKLLIKMLRSYRRKKEIGFNSKNNKNKLTDDIINYLKKNYNKKLVLDDIARLFYISRSHLSNIFRKTTGMSVLSYIQKLRIENACSTLTDDLNMTVLEVAQKSGYKDYNFFNKTFKKITGLTPGEYRKKNS